MKTDCLTTLFFKYKFLQEKYYSDCLEGYDDIFDWIIVQ